MLNTEKLIKVIGFWRDTVGSFPLVTRDIVSSIDLRTKEIVDITGVRRAGKSSIFKLLILNLDRAMCLYINFEDPFFIENNSADIIEDLIEVYRANFSINLKYLFFDEIQNISGWERAIRKFRDSGKYKIFITGSSSKLLSSELSSSLTGRHLSYTVFPFSFREYLSYHKVEHSNIKQIAINRAGIIKHFTDYLARGGFPEVVLTENFVLLRDYFYDIVQKDVMARHNIRQKEVLERIGMFLLTNSSKQFSLNSIQHTFGISFELARDYVNYFKETFLFLELKQFSFSLKKQEKAAKKIYCVDLGMATTVSFKFSDDRGRLLEHVVFLELCMSGADIYYYKNRNNQEVDFFIRAKKKELIQVCWTLEDERTSNREINALLNSMDELKLSEALVLTYNTEREFIIRKKRIVAMPVWKWILTRGK